MPAEGERAPAASQGPPSAARACPPQGGSLTRRIRREGLNGAWGWDLIAGFSLLDRPLVAKPELLIQK